MTHIYERLCGEKTFNRLVDGERVMVNLIRDDEKMLRKCHIEIFWHYSLLD